MKNLIFAMVAVAALLVTATAEAQQAGPRGGGQNQDRGMAGDQRMQEAHRTALASLNLTAKQKAHIAALDKKRDADMKALRERAQGGDHEAMRTQGRTIRENYRNGLQATLTPQQWEAYQKSKHEAMQKEAQNRRGAGDRPKPGSGTKPGKPGKP